MNAYVIPRLRMNAGLAEPKDKKKGDAFSISIFEITERIREREREKKREKIREREREKEQREGRREITRE